MDISQFISELLFEHECVIVPGMGGFIANYSPAKVHPVSDQFLPPTKTIAFNINLNSNDGLLINHLAASKGINYQDARRQVESFVAESLSRLRQGLTVSIPGIGEIHQDPEGHSQFTPEEQTNYLADSFGLSSFVSPKIQRVRVAAPVETVPELRQFAPAPRKKNRRSWMAVAASAAVLAGAVWFSFNVQTHAPAEANFTGFVPLSNTHTTPVKPATTSIAAPAKTPASTPAPIELQKPYHIVCGAFGSQSNAAHLVNQLKAAGHEASLVGKSKSGLFRVSIQSYATFKEAIQKMKEFRLGDHPTAWVLKK